MKEFHNAHNDTTWVDPNTGSWEARCRPCLLREKHLTDPEARDVAEDCNRHAHLSQDFERVTSCMIDQTLSVLKSLKNIGTILHDTTEERGEDASLDDNTVQNMCDVLNSGVQALTREHNACMNTYKLMASLNNNQTTTNVEVMQPDTWIGRLHQWNNENRIAMINRSGEEITIDFVKLQTLQ